VCLAQPSQVGCLTTVPDQQAGLSNPTDINKHYFYCYYGLRQPLPRTESQQPLPIRSLCANPAHPELPEPTVRPTTTEGNLTANRPAYHPIPILSELVHKVTIPASIRSLTSLPLGTPTHSRLVPTQSHDSRLLDPVTRHGLLPRPCLA
jgi:hypothetical protein